MSGLASVRPGRASLVLKDDCVSSYASVGVYGYLGQSKTYKQSRTVYDRLRLS